jgi:hypothetical protein
MTDRSRVPGRDLLWADAAAHTDAERACLAALRRATGTVDGPMERHGLRVFVLMEAMATAGRLAIDREVALCASLLHDVGLYPCAAAGDAYVADSRRFLARTLASSGWPATRLARGLDAVEYHHVLWAQWPRGVETELLRRADLIDVSAGLVRFRLPRARVREVFRALPRDGFYGEIARLVARVLRERPASLPGIFMRPRGGPRS